MNKLTPMAEISVRRMGLDGVKNNSLHTPFPCQLLEEDVAAFVISASLASASSSESDVFINIRFASSNRPFMTSQRGDSGITITPRATMAAGTAASPSISLQLICSWTPDKA
ncbi:hypothetical protein CFOL_v3_25568 [Cephalotus follicularis]|uniref:Uncharacterized protein n=1 Tax=Cephalotus follicularis TaxID=3775 RepID=A0A1Q3CPM3_CEPFO|nr:hypothetical protein CFOL_v3_25568 [Cephalotus follicularis]